MQGTATTYAVQRVRGAMLDELRARDWVPRSVRRMAREAAKVMQQLEQALGRPAAEQEIADKLNIGLPEYQQLLQDSNNSQLCSYDEWHEVHGESCERIIEVDDEPKSAANFNSN